MLGEQAHHCGASTVNRNLAAVASFYRFHARHEADGGRGAASRRGYAGTAFRPFLQHVTGRRAVAGSDALPVTTITINSSGPAGSNGQGTTRVADFYDCMPGNGSDGAEVGKACKGGADGMNFQALGCIVLEGVPGF